MDEKKMENLSVDELVHHSKLIFTVQVFDKLDSICNLRYGFVNSAYNEVVDFFAVHSAVG